VQKTKYLVVHPKKRGVFQGCGLNPYLFNIFINDIVEYLDTEERHSLVTDSLRFLGLLFVDDFAIASFTTYGLPKKIEVVNHYCKIRREGNGKCEMENGWAKK
jgi:hypothetical protein